MPTNRPTLYLPILLLSAILLITGLACLVLIPTPGAPLDSSPQPAGTARQPTNGQATPEEFSGSNLNESELHGPGDYNLPAPSAGLNGLDNYTQNFTYTLDATLNGQPYQAHTLVRRIVFTAGSSLGVLEATRTGGQPIYRAALRQEGGLLYVQQAAGQPCRASQDPKRADAVTDPSLRLPPVYGAERIGRDEIEGLPAIHYQFDQRAVRYAAGQSGTASGDLWVTEGSPLVLKYNLTIESTEGEAPGVQTWEYSVSHVNTSESVSLPQGCLTLPLDLPLLSDAQNVILLPGFARYSSASTPQAALQFYRDEMTRAGWSETPVDESAAGPLALTYTRPDGEGAQLASVRIEPESAGVQIIIQLMRLKNVPNSAAGNAPVPNASPTETP